MTFFDFIAQLAGCIVLIVVALFLIYIVGRVLTLSVLRTIENYQEEKQRQIKDSKLRNTGNTENHSEV